MMPSAYTDEYTFKKFLYNNALLLIQTMISLLAISFCAAMLAIGRDPSIYLPVMTGCIGYFLPSPISHKVEQPSGMQLLTRGGNVGSINNV